MMKSSKDEELGDRDMDVIRSERSLQNIPPTYSPSLVFIHGKEYCEQTFATLTDEHTHIRSVPEMCQMRCLASCYGWLIMHNRNDSSQCYLFNPISLKKIHLPPLRHSNFVVGALTSSPIDNNCVVLLASTKRNSFVRCQIGDEEWIEKDLGPKSKRRSYKRYLFTKILSCDDNIYLFCEDGMFVIHLHNLSTKFHKREWSDIIFANIAYECLSFKHFFVESCGEVFHIILTYYDKILANGNRFCGLDVFRLEVSEMTWVQVKSLDDRIFLLGATSSVSFSSTEFGMKGNCIYFWITNKYTMLSIFDMDDGSLPITLPSPKHLSCWDGPFWVLPNCKLQVKKKVAMLEEVKYVQDDEKNLPIELLEIILSADKAFLDDCIRFRLICKSRIPITPPFRPYTSLIQTKSESNQLPWLLSMPKNKKGLCNLYHPVYSDAYTMNIPHEFDGAVVRCAKYGWLLMSQGETSIFFFNPSSKETIQLPDTTHGYDFKNITFSSIPTSPDLVVFGHVAAGIVDVYCKCVEEDIWNTYEYIDESGLAFSPALCSPVFYDGVIYSLGKQGNLGILNPSDKDEETVFNINPNVLAREVGSSFESRSFRSFLMEYDGEILSVFVGHSSATPVWVCKFDQSKKEWIKLESLGDKVMFLSHTGSIVVPAGLKGVENRIYLPRFQGRDIVYYSLSTCTYHCFGETISAEDWINTYEDFNCTWIQIQNQEDGTKRDAPDSGGARNLSKGWLKTNATNTFVE